MELIFINIINLKYNINLILIKISLNFIQKLQKQ